MSAPWLVAMDWRDTLFVHWPVAPELLRDKIPPGVELDVFDGSAWISIVAFRVAGTRLRGVPARLAWRTFGEVNVRTYATAGGKPGVVFLSLDAASRAAVAGGRALVHLAYHRARVAIAWDGAACSYHSERTGTPTARFAAEARIDGAERVAAPGSLEHQLVERYCFYTVDARGRTVRGDVRHPPWPLHDATATIAENTLLAAANVTPQAGAVPLVHASPGVATRARALVRV